MCIIHFVSLADLVVMQFTSQVIRCLWLEVISLLTRRSTHTHT